MNNNIKPASLLSSIGIFSVSCCLIIAGVYIIIPALLKAGVPFFIGYLLAFQTIPFIILFGQMLYLYKKEQNTMTWQAFAVRMRLAFSWKILVLGLGLFILGVLTYIPLQSITRILAATSLFAPPDWFPADLHPLKSSVPGEFMGMPMRGMVWVPIVYLIGWFFNIFGEELLFRGYLLPRQELRYGKYAWLVNGLLWNVWHVFWRWQMPALLPFHLLLTFLAQKHKNTWIGIIGHGLINFIAIVMLIRLCWFAG